MTEERRELLQIVYNDYINDQEYTQFKLEGSDASNLKYLLDAKYIQRYCDDCNDYMFLTMTSSGVDLVENCFMFVPSIPVIYGDNNIFVNGSNNTVSNNYSSILQNIQNSQIPPEHKDIMLSLIRELQTSPKKTYFDKIKNFLGEILASGVNTAVNQSISLLISELFKSLS